MSERTPEEIRKFRSEISHEILQHVYRRCTNDAEGWEDCMNILTTALCVMASSSNPVAEERQLLKYVKKVYRMVIKCL